MADAEKHLGHQHKSKPQTPGDKVMSKRHLAHRAEIEARVKKYGPNDITTLKKSIAYNEDHAKEHIKAKKESLKMLKKATKESAKRVKKAGK